MEEETNRLKKALTDCNEWMDLTQILNQRTNYWKNKFS